MSSHTAAWIDGGLFLTALAPIVAADIREQRVPDVWIALGFLLLLSRRLILPAAPGGSSAAVTGLAIWPAAGMWLLLDACVGFLFIWIVWCVSRRKIGLGDAKLSGLIAFFLGIPGWILALLFASLSGIVFAAVRIGRGKMERRDRIPFAPFLGAGAAAGFAAVVLAERMGYVLP